MYLISVIMPIYNAEKYLEGTIQSIINQTFGFENIELILVDDNSSDSSGDIIREFSNKYINVKSFFSDKNHGFPGYGRNVGLKKATADYIMFIDNDDQYEPDFCEKVYNTIEKEKCDVVSANFHIIEDKVIIKEDVFSRINSDVVLKEGMKFVDLSKYRNVTDSVIWTKIFKKSIIAENNITFVEDRLSEDRLFLFDYYYYAKNLVLMDYFGYIHNKHGGNLSYFSSKTTLAFLNSYYDVLDSVREKYVEIDINDLFRDNVEVTLYCTILSSNQKCLLEKLYKFEKDVGFNSSLNHSWANLCNKLLLKRRFSLVLIIFKVLGLIIRFINFLRKKGIY